MMIKVTGTDGTDAYIAADDVLAILPGQDDAKPVLPTHEQNGIPIVGREVPEIVVSIVSFKAPGQAPIVIAEKPRGLASGSSR